MAYNPNIPQATDIISQSQNQLLANFQELSLFLNINHVDFNIADAGKHKFVTMPAQAFSPPVGAFALGEVGIYGFLNPVTNRNEIYVNKRLGNNLVNTQIASTASILSTTPAPLNNTDGWTYLPSGLLLKWGNGNANGATIFPFPVSPTIPVFTQVLSMELTTYSAVFGDSNTFVALSTFNNATFNCYGSSRTNVVPALCSFQYLAIGY